MNQSMALLKLTVNNHPGVLAHVCGLFTRRAYNLEGVMVRPIVGAQGQKSRIWLLVQEQQRLQQIIRQTAKLVDVIDVEQAELSGNVFAQTERFFV